MNFGLFKTARSLGKNFERRLSLLRWYLPKEKTLRDGYTAHILAVKRPEYSRIGKIAVASFLYHNPNSKVQIHCDKFTIDKAKIDFRFFIKKKSVEIVQVLNEHESWQLQKIQLLQEIANLESQFYMDCDVRWNGSLLLPTTCACYVSEFKLVDKSPFRELFPVLGLTGSEVEMLNTTFVYLYPGKFNTEELFQIRAIHDAIQEKCHLGLVADLDIEQVIRLSEQLAFSIFMKNSRRDYVPLKANDGHMDGSFLESSYFGATGVAF